MKRFLSLLLSAVMLLSVPAMAVGCARADENDPSVESATSAVSEGETEDLSYTDELGELDFGGQKISILSAGQVGAADELVAEEMNQELINDAVYERNKIVENRLNVELTVQTGGESDAQYVANHIHTMILSGGSDYQLCGGPSYVSVQYVVKGDYLDLVPLEHLDLDKLYWSQGYNDMISWGDGHQFVATGAAALSLFRYMYVTLYNKDVLAKYHLTDPFEFVQNGTWTVAKQAEITADIKEDLNGDGRMNNKDYYGFVGGSFVSSDCYWISCAATVLQKDEDGYIVYDADIDRLSGAMDLVQGLYFRDCSFIFNDSGADNSYCTNTIEFFAAGRCFMTNLMITRLETGMSEFTGDYGILPIPKYDEYQKEYRTCVQDQVTGFSIPTSVPEKLQEVIGAFLECLASESYRTVVNAYYNTALSYRYLNNPESKIMLDLIYDSVSFEIAQIYTSIVGSFLGSMRNIVCSKRNNVTSTFKRLEKSMIKSVDKLNKDYIKVVNG